MKEKCADCKFWKALKEDRGQCRVRAPNLCLKTYLYNAACVDGEALAKLDAGIMGRCVNYDKDIVTPIFHMGWPYTKPDDWCGEFKQKEEGQLVSIDLRDCPECKKLSSEKEEVVRCTVGEAQKYCTDNDNYIHKQMCNTCPPEKAMMVFCPHYMEKFTEKISPDSWKSRINCDKGEER